MAPPSSNKRKSRPQATTPRRNQESSGSQSVLRAIRTRPFTLGRFIFGVLLIPFAFVVKASLKNNSYWPCATEFVALVVIAIFWQRWLDKRRKLNDPGVCRSCGYTLAGLGRSGNCPECGRGFFLDPTLKRPNDSCQSGTL